MLFDMIYRFVDPLKYAKKKGMRVGKGVTLAGRFGTSFGSEPYLITLEDEVRMSGGVQFFTHDGGTWAFRDLPQYKDITKFGAIHIGKRSFIGYGVKILPGVTIGERCVIGTGAIVTKNIPDHSVAVGVPAKVICSTEEYAENAYKKFCNEDWDSDSFSQNRKQYLIDKYVGKKY